MSKKHSYVQESYFKQRKQGNHDIYIVLHHSMWILVQKIDLKHLGEMLRFVFFSFFFSQCTTLPSSSQTAYHQHFCILISPLLLKIITPLFQIQLLILSSANWLYYPRPLLASTAGSLTFFHQLIPTFHTPLPLPTPIHLLPFPLLVYSELQRAFQQIFKPLEKLKEIETQHKSQGCFLLAAKSIR